MTHASVRRDRTPVNKIAIHSLVSATRVLTIRPFRHSLPKHGVEIVCHTKAFARVEANRVLIGFGSGESKRAKSLGFQVGGAIVDQDAANPVAAAVLGDAELCNVGDIFAYARTKQNCGNLVTAGMYQHAGCGRVEQSAPGKANDVVQKSKRAGNRAVLIVD